MGLFDRRTLQLGTLLGSLMISVAAQADGEAAKLDPASCSREQVGWFRDSQSEAVRRLTPQGLYYKQGTARHLLFGSSWSDKKRVVIVERDSGKTVASAATQDAAIVEDEAGKLLGIVVIGERRDGKRELQLQSPQGQARWKAPVLIDGFGDSASIVAAGELLVVAHFHRIATGSSLTALDLATGAIKWKADVQQLQIAHSKYWNDVTLTRAGSTLTLRGVESGGCHLQTFELATGKRLSAQLHQPR